MKIALATDGAVVSPHFGHCSEFTIATVDSGEVIHTTLVPNPEHQPGFLPEYLSKMGVSCIIAGGMGPRAQQLFEARGIKTVVGASGTMTEVLQAYLAGTLQVGESACDHGDGVEEHEGHGSCDHRHFAHPERPGDGSGDRGRSCGRGK